MFLRLHSSMYPTSEDQTEKLCSRKNSDSHWLLVQAVCWCCCMFV